MITLKLSRSSYPLYQQIIQQIKAHITEGTLEPGDSLPSTRCLAESNGVSRSTVIHAYEELWAQGYLESQPGSNFSVRRIPRLSRKQPIKSALFDWTKQCNPLSEELHQTNQLMKNNSLLSKGDGIIKMSGMGLDANLFPAELFRRTLNRVLAKRTQNLFNLGDPQGYLPLREFISDRLKLHDISVSSDEILITNGSQNSLNLLLSVLSSPGGDVIVENPTYFLLPPLLRHHRLNPLDVPMTESGMDLNILQQRLKEYKPRFLYTIPNFQNPTGITTSPSTRESLLMLCQKHRCPVIEDAFEEEMKYKGKIPQAIKTLDDHQLVIYLSSFSKVFFPGIRLGWIAADPNLIARLVSLKVYQDIGTNLPLQAALAEFGSAGHYDLHIRHLRRIYGQRMKLALKMLNETININDVNWSEPHGGFLIWLTLRNSGRSEQDIFETFLKFGVRVLPGSPSFVKPQQERYFRISISNLSPEHISEGIKRISRTLNEIYGYEAIRQ